MRFTDRTAFGFASATSMVGIGFLALMPATLSAQDYPTKPIRVLTTAAGGAVISLQGKSRRRFPPA